MQLLRRWERSVRRRLQTPAQYQAWREDRSIRSWERAGRPMPPPHAVKVRAVRDHARQFGTRTLVETGTFEGAMIEAVRGEFDVIHSIELASDLHARAVEKFRGDDGVHLHQGDSGEVLDSVLAPIEGACLFWLDGHYSGGATGHGALSTPILRELETIAAHPVETHVILIDDARCFSGADDYPTIDELRTWTDTWRPELEFHVADDIIRIHEPAVRGR